mgnify:CR=1 FL=1
MKTYCKFLFACPIVAALLAHSSCQSYSSIKIDNSTVKELDIPRFMGKWYEIARYEHFYGKIRVENKGIKNGEPKTITGKAKQPNPKKFPGRLKVSFFLWFYSDYYVLDVDKNYQYTLIGSSTEDYLWILSRTPELEKVTLEKCLTNLKNRGYDTSKLIFIEQ